MLSSFDITNFRSFDQVEVGDCRRINLVVGDNGSGKTALLEALFLALGVSPELAMRTRSWRGLDASQVSGTHEDLHVALWGDLFYKFQVNRAAVVSLRGPAEQNRTVLVRLNKRGKVRALPAEPKGRNKPGAPVRVVPERAPVEFRWRIRGFPDLNVVPTFVDNKLTFPAVPNTRVNAAFFTSSRTPPTQETANNFSKLSKSFLEGEFIDRFIQLFPMIKTLSIELNAGSPMLFAAVEGLIEKIPLGLVSSGMNKLAAILLSMAEHAGGVVLMDEIENGFYHERLPAIWDAILHFSRQYDCQVFASTHSAECLNAAARLAETSPDDFCMMRTVVGLGGTKVRVFDGKRFSDAILANIEVR